MKVSPSRLAAFEILNKIETENGFSSILLPKYEEGLGDKDRALCHELTLGVLRKQIYLDRLIDHFAKGKNVDTEVRIALRLGLYQLKFLDRIPVYSAINESVELTVYAKKKSAKGFVNAILRRSTREEVQFNYNDELDQLSVETSHPRALIEKWIEQFGFDETARLASANNVIPNVDLRLTAKSKFAENNVLSSFLWNDCRKSDFVDGCFIADRMSKGMLEMEAFGDIYFQDEASQMVASAVKVPLQGKFLDVCASPGSKLSAIAANFAASIPRPMLVGGDLPKRRVTTLRDNCLRQACDFVSLVRYDAKRDLPFAVESFEVVLVDAPCSGTGTIRPNPEIRYRLNSETLRGFARKQLQMLINASKLVTVNGLLIYSTCSLEREENETVCEQFLSDLNGFRSVPPDVPGRFLTSDGYARTFPQRDEMDGFFIAAFKKVQI